MTALAMEALSPDEFDQTTTALLGVQRDDGAIPWYRGGKVDPWNHVESAMALTLLGEHEAARAAFAWLAENQRVDGSWYAAYGEKDAVLEEHTDTNAAAYVATGLHLYLLATRDVAFGRGFFECVERALNFVVGHIDARGMLPWSVGPAGQPSRDSLLAASSSVVASLRSGAQLAQEFDKDDTPWTGAADVIACRIREDEFAFLDKSVYAMDWYYPVLAGVLDADSAAQRLRERAPEFLVPGFGVRCRSDGEWVTAAESAECAIAYSRVGLHDIACEIAARAHLLRDEDGSYATGVIPPHRAEFPRGERTTYSAAAAVIAADVLSGGASAFVFSRLS